MPRRAGRWFAAKAASAARAAPSGVAAVTLVAAALALPVTGQAAVAFEFASVWTQDHAALPAVPADQALPGWVLPDWKVTFGPVTVDVSSWVLWLVVTLSAGVAGQLLLALRFSQHAWDRRTVQAPKDLLLQARRMARTLGLVQRPKVRVAAGTVDGKKSGATVNATAVDDLAAGTTVIISQAAYEQLDRDALDAVLAHEMAHLIAWHPVIGASVRACWQTAGPVWVSVALLTWTSTGTAATLPASLAFVSAFGAVFEPQRVSRSLETHADLLAARALAGGRQQMADGLLAVWRAELTMLSADDRDGRTVSTLVPASPAVGLLATTRQALSTHPAVRTRIDRLQQT